MTATTPSDVTRALDLPRLTSLRAFAALAVFGFHLGMHAEWAPGTSLLGHGYVGVGFFFVLSGFVLAWGARPRAGVRDFYRRRFARVWPAHAVMSVVALAVPVTAVGFTAPQWLASLLLVQTWLPGDELNYAGNGVSWSLACEAFFYACLPPLLLLLLRCTPAAQVVIAGGWFVLLALVVAAAVRRGGVLDDLAYVHPVVRSGEFVLGVVAGLRMRQGWRPPVPLPAATALLALALVADRLLVEEGAVSNVVLALPFTLLICAAARRDLGAPARGWLASRLLVRMGEASFAFYLVHELLIINLLPASGVDALTGPSGTGWALLLLAVASGAALALHHGVERPAQRQLARPRSPVGA